MNLIAPFLGLIHIVVGLVIIIYGCMYYWGKWQVKYWFPAKSPLNREMGTRFFLAGVGSFLAGIGMMTLWTFRNLPTFFIMALGLLILMVATRLVKKTDRSMKMMMDTKKEKGLTND